MQTFKSVIFRVCVTSHGPSSFAEFLVLYCKNCS